MRVLLTTLVSRLAVAQGAVTRPNILHIHADDHRSDGLRALGNPLLQTPNLGSLVDRTQLFDLATDTHELNNLADPHPLSITIPTPATWTPPSPQDLPGKGGKAKARR